MYISYLGISKNFFFSLIILLADEVVLTEIQYIHDGRPVIPIFEHELIAEAHRYNF